MTSVHLALFRDGPDGHRPVTGSVSFCRTRRGVDGSIVVLPLEFSAPLVNGEATVDLAPTGPDWCWMVIEPTGAGIIRHIIVPDVEPSVVLEYSMLPDVDPNTLEPSAEPEAAWWAAVDLLSTERWLPAIRADPASPDTLLADVAAWQIEAATHSILVTVEED